MVIMVIIVTVVGVTLETRRTQMKINVSTLDYEDRIRAYDFEKQNWDITFVVVKITHKYVHLRRRGQIYLEPIKNIEDPDLYRTCE